MNAKCASCKNFWGSSEEMIWDGYSLICKLCPERKTMPNIKITAEVDGKQVLLENISTETFEAIKALEKLKEIPVARLADHDHGRRLIFRVTGEMVERKGQYIAIDLNDGSICGHWPGDDGNCGEDYGYRTCYENVRPL